MPQQYYTSNQYYLTTTSSSTMTTQIWPLWVNQTGNSTIIAPQNGYITTAVSPNQIWTQWVNQTQAYTYSPQYTYTQVVETPEQIAERHQREDERRQRRVAARARARTLLGEFLNDEQKAELERHGRFHVVGSKGRRYCIRAEGQSGNVDLLKPDGSIQARLCCHPRTSDGYLPEEDAWLMQMIEIRHDEDHFLRTANVHRGSLPVAA